MTGYSAEEINLMEQESIGLHANLIAARKIIADKDAHIVRQAEDIRLKDEALRRANARIRKLVQKVTEKNAVIERMRAALREVKREQEAGVRGEVAPGVPAYKVLSCWNIADKALRDTAGEEGK